MNEKFTSLLNAELHQENLKKLIDLCQEFFEENPALYGTLEFILEALADEYDNQAIPTERFKKISSTLQPTLIALGEAETSSPEVFLSRLNDVLRAYKAL